VLCYNVLLVASLVASAVAMHLFVRAVVRTEIGAYLAGLAWGFGSYRFAHLIHLQLQSLYFLPLAFLFLHRVIAGRRRRDVMGLGATAGVPALSVYYGIIGGPAPAVGGVARDRRWSLFRPAACRRARRSRRAIAPRRSVAARTARRLRAQPYEAGRNAAYVSSPAGAAGQRRLRPHGSPSFA
jgi:hypothetical protein